MSVNSDEDGKEEAGETYLSSQLEQNRRSDLCRFGRDFLTDLLGADLRAEELALGLERRKRTEGTYESDMLDPRIASECFDAVREGHDDLHELGVLRKRDIG